LRSINTLLGVGVLVFLNLTLTQSAWGQDISVGVILGTNLTPDFRTQYFLVPGYPQLNYLQTSGGSSLIGGPMIGFQIRAGFSAEIDGLYRGLHGNGPSPFNVVTWEFPLMAKYRFTLPFVKPFIEAGPQFRTAGNLNWANPSHAGVTGGVGLETNFRGLRIAPELRYTRWKADNNPGSALTRPDQVELLVGFSGNSGTDRHPLGSLVSFGVVLGTNLTGDYRSASSPVSIGSVQPNGQTVTIQGTAETLSGGKSFLVGPVLDVSVFRNLSIEANAIYRPERQVSKLVSADGNLFNSSGGSFVTWQFPVLAKYRFGLPFDNGRLKPFVEGGPDWRLAPQSADFSKVGVAAGAGIQTRLSAFQIAPELRYTHWASSNTNFGAVAQRNELQLLVGFSF
jgi:hypothetical protein